MLKSDRLLRADWGCQVPNMVSFKSTQCAGAAAREGRNLKCVHIHTCVSGDVSTQSQRCNIYSGVEVDIKLFMYSPACTLAELVCNIQTHRYCRLVRLDHDAGSVPERELL